MLSSKSVSYLLPAFKYSSSRACAAAAVITVLQLLHPCLTTGKTMAELISELVWQPIGAEEDADFTLDHFRTAIYNGGMCATLQGEYKHRGKKHISALCFVMQHRCRLHIHCTLATACQH